MILLTGGTGYIGGRLLRALEARGEPLRCLARRPETLRARAAPSTEVIEGDLLDGTGLEAALEGADTAYYLVHSLGSAGSYEEDDLRAAANFGRAARSAGLRRIIYLGGLGSEGAGLSSHLRSRQETGRVLRASGVPVLEFRASIVIGSGSLSFEMVRALVERLPVMVTPRWVYTPAQPIAIEDLIRYLVDALDLPEGESRILEIGGGERVTYGDLMREYARQRGLRRAMIPVPVLTPRLSGLWLGLVTPVYARVGRKLVEGLKSPTVVRDDAALRLFSFRPMGLSQAVARALANEDREFAQTRWSDAFSSGGRTLLPANSSVAEAGRPARMPDPLPTPGSSEAAGTPQALRTSGSGRFGGRIIDTRTVAVERPPEEAFAPIRRIGGRTGWYSADFLWRLRGFLDLLAGGVGLRRGRRDPEVPAVGDAVDFWRVEIYEPDRRLRLAAEMKLPGRAWLEFEVTPHGAGSTIRQTAIFDPLGLLGLAYWYALYPFHLWIFRGMLRGIARDPGLAAGVPPSVSSNTR